MKSLILVAILAYWPLFKNSGVTGTFCEYRFNHIHAGFDLSTEGKTGLPVRCYADGFVYMIKVKKNGYGNVIYIKHPKKKLISVYGHLKSFNGKLQEIVDSYRKKRKTKYPGLILLEERKIKVKKNEVIGFTGESGAGLPHLHFELRDYNNNPVDASKHGFDMRFDNTFPVIQGLKIIPQDSFSSINGRKSQVYVKAFKVAKNRYRFKKIYLSGNLFFSLNVYDTAGRGKVGVKSIKFFLNGSLVFEFNPFKFSFDNFKQSCCAYDFEDTSLSPTDYFYNLFKIEGCNLGVSKMFSPYRFKRGKNRVKIVVSDFHNNFSVLTGIVEYRKFKGKPADFSPLSVTAGGKVVFADKIESMMFFNNYAVFPYNDRIRKYRYGRLTLEITGINKKKRLLRIYSEKGTDRFLIPIEGTFFRIERENEFIKTVKYSIALKKVDKTYGVYFFNKFKKRWIFIGDEFKDDVNDKVISADYYRVGKIGVFIDKIPPEIKGNPFYFDGKFVIKVRDRGKGVNDETAVLKGKTGEFFLEYDKDRKWLFYDGKIPSGEYVLTVEDFAGNRVIKKVRVK